MKIKLQVRKLFLGLGTRHCIDRKKQEEFTLPNIIPFISTVLEKTLYPATDPVQGNYHMEKII